jgi:hypothetical protein
LRPRLLIGTAMLVFGLVLYALLAMRLAVAIVPEHWAAQTLFYAVTGIAWVYPAARLTRWMQADRS